ncbi:hypothetical protein ABPG74_006599 [Tetrahymena malaccensis]
MISDQSTQCLQMAVLDKKLGIKKVIEVFLVEQMQSQIEQFVKHVQLCKSLIRTDLVLKIFDSYFLDDPDEADQQSNLDQNLYYVIEYEYFDYSNRDIFNNQSVRQNTNFQAFFLNQPDQQQQQVDNYLYDIFRYCERILCPYKKRRGDISQADIKSLAFITFKQEINQPQVMKLNPIDDYLFENQLNYTSNLTKQDQQIQQWPTRYIQSNQNIQIEYESFIIEFQNQFPKLFEQFSLILRQIVADNSQYVIFEPTTYQEKENILTISATFQNQHTQFKIKKFNNIDEAQEDFDKINLYQKQLNCISIQSLIKNQAVVQNEQGVFILTEVNLSIMNQIKQLVELNDQSTQCLQMAVLDKKLGIKKVIEVFLVEQMQSQIEQFVKHVQLCKSLIRTDLVLKIFDSYFLDDLDEADQQFNQDENLYYAIEYEYFDYSNRDIFNNQSVRQNTFFQPFFMNQLDQQQQQQVDNYLYDIFRYCERILCPYKKRREDISQADIKNLAFITFKQEINQPQVMKLNPIDDYLFENQLNYTSNLTKQDQQKQLWPTRYIQSNQNIQIEYESFIIEFQNQFPKLFEQFSLILRQIVADNSQYVIFEPTTYQEKENILTISATFQDQHTSFKIQKFNNIEEAQEDFGKINLYQKQLNCISIQSLIKNQAVVQNEQGVFILTELDLSIMNQIKKLVEIKQSNIQINYLQDDQQIYIQGLQDLEIYTKFLLWLINNFQVLLQLQVQPENMFISQDGKIYLKPANNNNSPVCDCCKYENRLEVFELLKIVTMFYILVVIQDEQKQKNDEIQQKCLVQEVIEFQNSLVKDQHQLKEITYDINYCQLLILELNKKSDFFDLKNKKGLVRLNAMLHELLVKDFYKQLKQNKHKINTLSIFIRSNNPFDNIQQGRNIFKKIPTLVQLL